VTASAPEHTGLRRILHSYRWRRRFVIWGIVCAIGGTIAAIAAVSIHNPNTAPHGGRATIVAQPKHAPFRPAERRQVSKVLAAFLSTAVARKHVASAWHIAGPELKSGLSKREWDTGAIPVQPYPVASKGLGQWESVEYSYHNAVGLSVLLFPRPGSGQAPATADVDVIKNHHGQWLVNYFMPNKYHGNPVPAAHKKAAVVVHRQKPLSQKQRRERAASHSRAVIIPGNPLKPHANRLYWAIPIAIFALVILTPLAVFTISGVRNRRAYNAHTRRRA
jgi:hypothetical protein